ncbi:hypothetical protein NDU88_003127 [Pleurodeles waltl]|uniref:Uncharacterized protein n=1 Tax=Pleurodeles waltl TaxID=8319 RepID=A0AAV7LHX6_PLEWA|nr:hypothetical protein NDU88_003127 [Pleurodeles waltl]
MTGRLRALGRGGRAVAPGRKVRALGVLLFGAESCGVWRGGAPQGQVPVWDVGDAVERGARTKAWVKEEAIDQGLGGLVPALGEEQGHGQRQDAKVDTVRQL